MSPVVERDVFIDSSETGWGATLLGREWSGLFESESIGQSSTFRELMGVRKLLSDQGFLSLLRGKNVRFNMDSSAAIANLMHSGKVRKLAPLVLSIWNIFLHNGIEPEFRWQRRNTTEMSHVDKLSKTVTFTLSPSKKQYFERLLGRQVLVMNHNKLTEVIRQCI